MLFCDTEEDSIGSVFGRKKRLKGDKINGKLFSIKTDPFLGGSPLTFALTTLFRKTFALTSFIIRVFLNVCTKVTLFRFLFFGRVASQ